MEVNSPEDAEVLIQKIPCDIGIHRNPRKGTLNAPNKILEGAEFESKVLVDEVFTNEFDLEETHERIYSNTRELADYGKPIVSLGGDHSISFPAIKALKQENPDMELVWMDAHLDLKEKIDGHVSHDVVVRELLESGFSEEEITLVGVTQIDQDEQEYLDKHNLEVYRAKKASKSLESLSSDTKVYLSVDIDVLNSEEASGTGYPDGGMKLEEVEKAIEAASPAYADLVEVAPPFDKENITVSNSRKILHKLLQEISRENPVD